MKASEKRYQMKASKKRYQMKAYEKMKIMKEWIFLVGKKSHNW